MASGPFKQAQPQNYLSDISLRDDKKYIVDEYFVRRVLELEMAGPGLKDIKRAIMNILDYNDITDELLDRLEDYIYLTRVTNHPSLSELVGKIMEKRNEAIRVRNASNSSNMGNVVDGNAMDGNL